MIENFFKGKFWKEALLFVIAIIVIYQLAGNWALISLGFSRFFRIVQPFLIGGVLAYFLSNPTKKIQQKIEKTNFVFIKRRSRGLAVMAIFLIIIALFSAIITWIVPIIRDNLMDFAEQFSEYYNLALELIWDLSNDDHPWADIITFWGISDLNGFVTNFMASLDIDTLTTQLLSSTNQILGHFVNTLTAVFNGVISMIICLYALLYMESITSLIDRSSRAFIKKRQLLAVKNYARKSNQIFINFVSAQFLDACILGTLATIILGILNVRYAVTLGVLLGIANMIPYFGSIFASGFVALITIFTGSPSQALIVLIALILLQQIDGNFIGPRITGDAVGVNPIIIIISITIGGHYFNVLGMFVSVPIAAMLKMFYFDYLDYLEQKRLLRGESL